MDFTCLPESGGLLRTKEILERLCSWVYDNSGIRFALLEGQRAQGDFQIEIPLEYGRGGSRKHGLPQVKIHVTFDEPILTATALQEVKPLYSDLSKFAVVSYSKEEILAEKMRALIQQQLKWPRPRDLYDLWFILCHRREQFAWERLVGLFAKKCEARAVTVNLTLLVSDELKTANEKTWQDRLGDTMASVPSRNSWMREPDSTTFCTGSWSPHKSEESQEPALLLTDPRAPEVHEGFLQGVVAV